MSRHFTPGPWLISPEAPVVYVYEEPLSEPAIAVAGPGADYFSLDWIEDAEEREANARLIAQAPALLDAVEELLQLVGDQDHPAVRQARATATKARLG